MSIEGKVGLEEIVDSRLCASLFAVSSPLHL